MKGLIRKAKGKKKAQLIHARRRFDGRFDIKLNDNQYQQLVNQIQNGRGEFVWKQSNRVTHWNINFENKWLRVVYDKRTKVIVTVLPLDSNTNDKVIDPERRQEFDNKLRVANNVVQFPIGGY